MAEANKDRGTDEANGGVFGLMDAVKEPFRRAPLECAIVIVLAVVNSAAIADVVAGNMLVLTWWLTSTTVCTAVLGATLLYEFGTIGRVGRWVASFGYIGAGCLYGVFVLHPEQSPEVYRWGLLTSALALSVFLTPLAANTGVSNRRRLVSQFAVRFLQRLFMAFGFVFALFVGIGGAGAAIEGLFDVTLPPEWIGYLITWLFAVGGPLTLLSGLTEITDEDPYTPGEDATRWMCHLGNWVFLPLAGLYLAILYIYEITVFSTGDAPKNLLSPLALGAAILVILGLFVLNLLRYTDRGQSLVERLEWLPVAYLPIVPMPLWAIAVRIQQHGWTEFRYARMLAAIGVLVAFGYAAYRKVRGRAFSIQALPATFAVLCMLGSFGPWGVVAVSKSSQQSLLRSELQQTGALKDGRVHPLTEKEVDEIDPSLLENIHSRANYLDDGFGRDALDAVAPGSGVSTNHGIGPLEALGYGHLADASHSDGSGFSRYGDGEETQIDYAEVKFNFFEGVPVSTTVDVFATVEEVEHKKGSMSLTLKFNEDESVTVDIEPLIEKVRQEIERGAEKQYGNYTFTDFPKELALFPVTTAEDRERGQVVFKKAWIQEPMNEDGEMWVTSVDGYLLLKGE